MSIVERLQAVEADVERAVVLLADDDAADGVVHDFAWRTESAVRAILRDAVADPAAAGDEGKRRALERAREHLEQIRRCVDLRLARGAS